MSFMSKEHVERLEAFEEIKESIGFRYQKDDIIDLVEVDGVFRRQLKDIDICYKTNKECKFNCGGLCRESARLVNQ